MVYAECLDALALQENRDERGRERVFTKVERDKTRPARMSMIMGDLEKLAHSVDVEYAAALN
jgi:hypothetical protein